jgi:hypothetical protein
MTPTTLNDAELLRLMVAGDESPVAPLYDEHQAAECLNVLLFTEVLISEKLISGRNKIMTAKLSAVIDRIGL